MHMYLIIPICWMIFGLYWLLTSQNVKRPNRFVRHPIYTSILIMYIGSAVALPRLYLLVGLALVFAGFWLKLKQEEVVMLNHFGPKYEDHRRRVKALIPAVL